MNTFANLNLANRKNMNKIVFVLIASLLYTFPVCATAPVREVKQGDSVPRFGGTCHLLRDSDIPLPAAFEVAGRQSAAIVFATARLLPVCVCIA